MLRRMEASTPDEFDQPTWSSTTRPGGSSAWTFVRIKGTMLIVESNMLAIECEHRRKHVPPWCYVSIRDITDPAIELKSGKTGGIAILDAHANAPLSRLPAIRRCRRGRRQRLPVRPHQPDSAFPPTPPGCGDGLLRGQYRGKYIDTHEIPQPTANSPTPSGVADHGPLQSCCDRPLQQPSQLRPSGSPRRIGIHRQSGVRHDQICSPHMSATPSSRKSASRLSAVPPPWRLPRYSLIDSPTRAVSGAVTASTPGPDDWWPEPRPTACRRTRRRCRTASWRTSGSGRLSTRSALR